jgi:hypothetical protein
VHALRLELDKVGEKAVQDNEASRHLVSRITVQADQLAARLCAADAASSEKDAEITGLKVWIFVSSLPLRLSSYSLYVSLSLSLSHTHTHTHTNTHD